MNKSGKQRQVLVSKIGSINQATQSDRDGLIDVLNLKDKPVKVYFIDEACFSCIDQFGNPFIFYYAKNRYINIKVPCPATLLMPIQRNEGNLAIALKSNAIQIVSTMNGKLLKTLKPHGFHILALDVNYLRGYMVSVSQDECVIWDMASYDRVRSLFAKTGKFSSGSFTPSGEELITVFEDKTVCVWSLSSFEVISKATLPQSSVKSQTCTDPSHCRALINTYQDALHILDTSNLLTSVSIPAGYSGIQHVVASKYVFVLTRTSQVLLIDSNRIVTQVKLPVGKTAVSIDTNQNTLIVALNTGEILLMDCQKIFKHQQMLDESRLKAGIDKELVYTFLQESQQFKENYNNNMEDYEGDTEVRKAGLNESSIPVKPSQNTSMNQSRQPYNAVTLSKTFKKSGQDPFSSLLSDQKLGKFLKDFGVFPDKQRGLSWKQILNLPLNQQAYNDLCSLGTHRAYQNLKLRYPVQSDSLLSRLQRTLSCLAHYCPLFAEVEYLPELVFPFVKLFQRGEELLLFEVVLAILVQHCQRFFEYFPNAPVGVLQLHDQLLKLHDPELFAHLRSLNYQPINYVWPSMRCFYTDRLNREQWLRLVDHLVMFSSSPWFLVLVSVAYLQYFRSTFLNMQSQDQLEIFFARKNPIDMEKLLSRALKLIEVSDPAQFCVTYDNHLPLAKEQYQIFNIYPKHTVEIQRNIRSQLDDQDEQQVKRQNALAQLNQMAEDMLRNEELQKDRQSQLVQAQKDRSEIMEYEMQMRLLRQQKVDQELRDKRLSYIQRVEEMLRQAMEHQDTLRKTEDEALYQQLQRHKQLDNQQMLSRKEEEALLDLEFKAFTRFQGVMSLRNQEEKQIVTYSKRNRQVQHTVEYKTRQQQLAQQLKMEQWRTEEQEQRLKQELMRNQYMQSMQGLQSQNDRAQAEQELVITQMQEELKMLHLERDKRLREVASAEQLRQEQIQEIIDAKERALQDQERLLLQRQAKQFQQSIPPANGPQPPPPIDQNALLREREQIARMQAQNRNEEFHQRYEEIQQMTHQMASEDEARLREFQAHQERERQKQQAHREQLQMQEQELSRRKDYFQERDQRQIQMGNERENFENFRHQLHEELAAKQLDREQLVHDEHLRELVSRQREQEILYRGQQLRQQIGHEVQETGKHHYRRPHPYDDTSYSPQMDDERIISNQSDLSGSSSKYFR